MEKIQANSEFRAISDKIFAIETELQEINRKRETILAEIRAKASKDIDPWEAYVQGGEIPTHPRASFQEELKSLEQREQFLVAARNSGRQQLDVLRGQLSLEVCQSRRSEFAAQVRVILQSLETICSANARIAALRSEIEDGGYGHGSIPYCEFNVGGGLTQRDENYGSRPVFWRREMFTQFPELKSTGAKLRAVVGR